jgi:PST family polysaccharide transporter
MKKYQKISNLFEEDKGLSGKDSSRRTLNNVVINIIFQGFTFVLGLGSNLILARLLTPEDFGLVASVVLLTTFLGIINSGGLAQATIRESSINHQKISALVWVNVCIGLILAVISLIAAPFIAGFFGDARITQIIYLFSLSILATSVSIQYRALLLRNFLYLKLNTIDLLCLGTGISTSVLLAMNGFGYWSIVIGTTTTAVLKPIGYVAMTRWLPSLVLKKAGIRSMLKFGADVIGFQFINYFTRNLDNILIGRVLGVAALGQYSFAYRLAVAPIAQICGPINNALLPALSRLKDEPEAYQEIYSRYTRLLAIFLVLPIASAGFFGQSLLIYLAGPEWSLAGETLEWLALACCMQPLANLTGIVFLTTGRTRPQLYWALFIAPFVWATFYFTVDYGVIALSKGYLIVNLCFTPVSLIWAFHGTKLSLKKYMKIYLPLYLVVLALAGARFSA